MYLNIRVLLPLSLGGSNTILVGRERERVQKMHARVNPPLVSMAVSKARARVSTPVSNGGVGTGLCGVSGPAVCGAQVHGQSGPV